LFAWLVVRAKSPSHFLTRAEKHLAAGNDDAARKDLEKAVSLLEDGKGRAVDREELLAQAYLQLGDLCRDAGERTEAFANYKNAREAGARLPEAAVCLMAECYAAEHAHGEDALRSYLVYLSSRRPTHEASDAVFAEVQKLCLIAEETRSSDRKEAAALCQRVIAVRPDLEWAHYSLGLSHLLEGRTSDALASFSAAQQLDRGRRLTSYWKCVCFLQQADPDVDSAIEMAELFLPDPTDDARNQKRKARACSMIGMKLIERLGGFESTSDWNADERRVSLDKVLHYFQLAVDYQGDDAELHFLLGGAQGLRGDAPGMLAELERAESLNPNEPKYPWWLGKERYRLGDLDGAEKALNRVIAWNIYTPDDEMLAISWKRREKQLGRAGTVAEGPAVEGPGGAHPYSLDALALLGEVLMAKGDFAEAERMFRIARSQPESGEGILPLQLRALFGLGRYGRVIEELRSFSGDLLTAARDREAVFAVARSFALTREFEQAASWLEKLGGEERASYFLGCAYANLRRFAEARACFGAVAERDGEFAPRAMMQRGHIALAEGSVEAAEADYFEAGRCDENNPAVECALGLLALEKGVPEVAEQRLKKALAAAPDNALTRFALGVAYERLGQTGQAIENYLLVPEGSVERPQAGMRAGILLCRDGNFELALKAFSDSEGVGFKGPSLRFYRGIALARSGRVEETIADWKSLHEEFPQNDRLTLNLARAHYLAGCEHLEAGRIEEAIQSWAEYLALYPDDEKAARDVAELQFRLAAESISTEAAANLARCTELLRATVKGDPANPVYFFYGSLAKLRSGRAKECLEELHSAVATEGRQPRLLYHFALAMLATGDRAEAMKIFAEILDASPRETYARYAAWALGNERVRDGETGMAMAILSEAATEFQLSNQV